MASTILVVDDEAVTRSTLETILGGDGYVVFSASTAAEALEIFGTKNIDLVLLDYLLHDENENLAESLGPQLKRLKPNVRIIVLSGDPRAEEARSFADQLVAKPVHPRELLELIATFLQSER